MQLMPWSIASWPHVECYLPHNGRVLLRLHHANTRCLRDEAGRRAGDTVWVGRVGDEAIGMAWEWFELRPRVLAMEDPNSVITNLRFVDTRDQVYLEPLAAIVAANRLIHATPWQDAVLSVIGSLRYAEAENLVLQAA